MRPGPRPPRPPYHRAVLLTALSFAAGYPPAAQPSPGARPPLVTPRSCADVHLVGAGARRGFVMIDGRTGEIICQD